MDGTKQQRMKEAEGIIVKALLHTRHPHELSAACRLFDELTRENGGEFPDPNDLAEQLDLQVSNE